MSAREKRRITTSRSGEKMIHQPRARARGRHNPSLTLGARKGLLAQPVAHDAEERLDGVFEADLLAFFVGAAGVADGNLIDAPARPAPGDLGGELRLETEAVGLQRK